MAFRCGQHVTCSHQFQQASHTKYVFLYWFHNIYALWSVYIGQTVSMRQHDNHCLYIFAYRLLMEVNKFPRWNTQQHIHMVSSCNEEESNLANFKLFVWGDFKRHHWEGWKAPWFSCWETYPFIIISSDSLLLLLRTRMLCSLRKRNVF